MSERRRINEVATPQGEPYKRASYPGQHDPELVAMKLVADAAVNARRTSDKGELQRMSEHGRPDYWTARMEAQLGEHGSQMAARAALHLETGDRNTHGDGTVTVGVDDARMQLQRAVAAGQATGGGAGDVVVENNLSKTPGSVAEIDGLLGRLRAASINEAPAAVSDHGENTRVIVPAAALSDSTTGVIKARPDYLNDPAFRGNEATRTINSSAASGTGERTVAFDSKPHGEEVTHRLSAAAVNGALSAGDLNRTHRSVGERGGVIGGGYPVEPGEKTFSFQTLNHDAPGERTAIIPSPAGPGEITQVIGGGDIVGINTLLGFDPSSVQQIRKV